MSLDPALRDEARKVAEAAALAAYAWVGRGDEKAADHAAVEAMRTAFDAMQVRGTVVIGEGERDEAPRLYTGESVGRHADSDPAIDIALDPLEGTTIAATAGRGALAVMAIAGAGGLLRAPDVYMDKLAVGVGLPANIVDLDRPIAQNLERLAGAQGVGVEDLTVCVLDRPRHAQLIADIKEAGAQIKLIGDGDVAACIAVTRADSGIDMYVGSGGAPEGVLAAAALRCLGGQFQGRLVFRSDDERARAKCCGITDLDRKYALRDLVPGDVMFVATGVTDGDLLNGVKETNGALTTQSIVLHAMGEKSLKRVTTRHKIENAA